MLVRRYVSSFLPRVVPSVVPRLKRILGAPLLSLHQSTHARASNKKVKLIAHRNRQKKGTMHRGVLVAVVLAVAFLFLAAEGRLSLFQAGVTIVDQDLTTPSNKRTYNATIYYQDDDGLSSPGTNPTQRMRTDVFLASSGQTLTFLDIYEKVRANKSILQTTS